jgi:hypothetical protein
LIIIDGTIIAALAILTSISNKIPVTWVYIIGGASLVSILLILVILYCLENHYLEAIGQDTPKESKRRDFVIN